MPQKKKPGAGVQRGVVETQSESNGGNLGEEFVSLGTVQESMVRTIFDSVVNSLNSRVNDVLSLVSSIKASLAYSQKEIEDLKPLQAKLDKPYEMVDKIVSDIEAQQLKTEYLKNQSRRNNIRVNGIEESDREMWRDSEKKAVQEKLGMDISIERAHRFVWLSKCWKRLKKQNQRCTLS